MFLWDSIRGRFGRASVPGSPLFRSHFALVDDSAWRERLASGDSSVAQVYADWLEEQGDGRAELMRRASSGDELEAFLSANGALLLGPLALLDRSRAERPELELRWESGLLRGASVRPDDPEHGQPWELVRLLMQGAIGQDLRSLSVGISQPMTALTSPESFEGLVAPLVDLFVGDFTYPDECEMSWAELGDVSAMWKTFPRLESVTLRGAVATLGPIEAPVLRRFVHETSGFRQHELDAVQSAQWPLLEHLELWVGGEAWGADVGWDALKPVLEKKWPRLTSLAIRNFLDADRLVDWLVESPLLRQLKALDVSLGGLTDAGAERLIAGRSRLAHLGSIDLSDNQLSTRHFEALKTVAPVVRLERQRRLGADGERYVAVGE